MEEEGKPCCGPDRFVRHAGDGSSFPMSQAVACATCGIRHAFSTQRNFKVHAVFAALAVVLGFALRIPQPSWLAVILCIVAVFALETLNTAVESIVDLVSPEWNRLAMVATDCAAGSVFLAAVGSLVVAAVVYLPPAIELASSLAGA